MLLKKMLCLALVACDIFVSSCRGSSRIEAEDIPPEIKADYVIKPGMSRDEVESVLGMPTDIGVTKDGNSYAHYKFGTTVRSVAYDSENEVVVAYP